MNLFPFNFKTLNSRDRLTSTNNSSYNPPPPAGRVIRKSVDSTATSYALSLCSDADTPHWTILKSLRRLVLLDDTKAAMT